MTWQQPSEPQSQHAQYRRFSCLLRLIADLQKQEMQKGVMVRGTSGVGKSLGIKVLLSPKEQ